MTSFGRRRMNVLRGEFDRRKITINELRCFSARCNRTRKKMSESYRFVLFIRHGKIPGERGWYIKIAFDSIKG